MGHVSDEELRSLRQQQQILYRQEDRKEITQEEFKRQIEIIERKIKDKIEQIINEQKEEVKPQQSSNVQVSLEPKETKRARMEYMADEKKEVKVRVKKDKPEKEKRVTRVGVILEVLKMKSIKNMEQAADKVIERLPGSDRKKVCSQISLTIGKIKKGQGSWAKYAWDAESYTVSEKSQ